MTSLWSVFYLWPWHTHQINRRLGCCWKYFSTIFHLWTFRMFSLINYCQILCFKSSKPSDLEERERAAGGGWYMYFGILWCFKHKNEGDGSHLSPRISQIWRSFAQVCFWLPCKREEWIYSRIQLQIPPFFSFWPHSKTSNSEFSFGGLNSTQFSFFLRDSERK